MPEPRAYAERRADTLNLLATPGIDAWLSTVASHPYVTPLPMAWHQESVLIAVPEPFPATRHLKADPRVRLGVGSSADCVVIDAQVTDSHSVPEFRKNHGDLMASYEAQTGAEPADSSEMYVFRPRRIQAWRGEFEGADRTLMHDGMWLVQPTSG
ncbi:hypothetical protein [Mariniluteicoccus flavus]